jgi:predicted TIM-barrel fold metal-dependent hydrolase
MNDDLAEQVLAAHPSRFAGFAAVALQDVSAAGEELERAVSKLGFRGAMINSYTNIDDMNTAQYLDEPPVWDFWARLEALDVPSTCIRAARCRISGVCTRVIPCWPTRHGVSVPKQPHIRFV